VGPEISARTEHTIDNPRIVVKLREDIVLPRDERFEKHFDELDGDAWREIRRLFPAITVRRGFTAVPLERLRELADKACQCDSTYRAVDLSTYFEIEGPWNRKDAGTAVRMLRAWKNAVKVAYVEPPSEEPGGLKPGNDPRFFNQGYLQRAPGGIDAVFAWEQPGGGGQGQKFFDLERGWTLNHKDLVKQRATLVHGQIVDSARPHGTSVLGVVCGVDNDRGGAGVASKSISVSVVSSYPGGRANAILAATDKLDLGGVLLIESQLPNLEVGEDTWLAMPIEAVEAEFDAIRQATAKGITVVECAGNGGNNLDDFTGESGDHLLRRGVRDSGAIIVGAANVRTSPTRSRFFNSNYGGRVDCYAWGEDIDTADSTDTAPFSVTSYTQTFRETSGAGAIIAGAALCIQGIVEASGGPRLDAFQMRDMLCNPSTGTPSHKPSTDRIGVMPNLRKIIENNGLLAAANGTKKTVTKKGGSG
jgi:hypothetical protein